MASQRAEQRKNQRERGHDELETELNQHQPAKQTHLVVEIWRAYEERAPREASEAREPKPGVDDDVSVQYFSHAEGICFGWSLTALFWH